MLATAGVFLAMLVLYAGTSFHPPYKFLFEGRKVAVVNQTMVERFWRGGDPVGQRIQVKGRWLQVIGVLRPQAGGGELGEPARGFFLREFVTQ